MQVLYIVKISEKYAIFNGHFKNVHIKDKNNDISNITPNVHI